MKNPTLILTTLTIAAAALLSSCGQKPRTSFKELVPAEAVAMAWIGDVPSYRDLYPESVFDGALVLQKISVAKSGGAQNVEQLTALKDASEIVLSVFEQLSGEFMASVTPIGGFDAEPAIQFIADYDGELTVLESALSEIADIGPIIDGETYGEYVFKSRTITSKMSLHYALSNGLLVSGTDLPSLKASIEALKETPLPASITSNANYQRAVSLSGEYDGGIIFGQITDEFREFLASDLEESGPSAELGKNILGFDGIDAAFISYPEGKEALRSGLAGIIFHEKIGLVNLLKKPASPIKLPEWADKDAYLNWTIQSDPVHFQKQLLAIIDMAQPGAAASFQQVNQQATMFIGVSVDELFSDVFGDQVTISLKMDEDALAAAMAPQAGQPQSPIEEATIEIAIKDTAKLKSIMDKILTQTGGALQAEAIGDATLYQSPMPIPNLKPGSKASLGITEGSFFLSVSDDDKLRDILSGDEIDDSGAFQSSVVERTMGDNADTAFTVLKANYESFSSFFESFASAEDVELSDQEEEDLEAYIEFILSYLEELVIVGTEKEDAFVFKIGMGD